MIQRWYNSTKKIKIKLRKFHQKKHRHRWHKNQILWKQHKTNKMIELCLHIFVEIKSWTICWRSRQWPVWKLKSKKKSLVFKKISEIMQRGLKNCKWTIKILMWLPLCKILANSFSLNNKLKKLFKNARIRKRKISYQE